MIYVFLFPFVLQAFAMLFDEFYFHRKRGLPRWERIGHPLDTLSVLLCFAWVLFVPFNPFALKIYIAIALFSCIFITKDEFVHKDCCPAAEQWLHALLFVNHSLVLALVGTLWPLYKAEHLPSFLIPFLSLRPLVPTFLQIQASIIALFCLYQVVYWNVLWKEKA